ncbi:hypothetical protein Z043_109209 [Scleropages formosus]|uniref:BTB domain-containing protein n=1 Tax=Scleropages formosus TaxID=113540 RepID=A0A0P7V9P1_SCLFO|nr:hypothetical protein Z043_109209 [Scleropages formosus]
MGCCLRGDLCHVIFDLCPLCPEVWMWRYCKPRFERLLLEELQRQQRGSMFCDTVLQAGGISVPAHSCVLSALSPQFAHALSVAPTACAGQNQLIEFQTVDARTLLKLVGFFYSGELDVEGEQEREKVITAVSKLGIGSLVSVGRQGDGELGGIWEGANELFNQVEGKKETGVQTDCQNERQRRVWTMTEGDKEDERVTLARKAAQLPTTTRDRETQTELGDLTQNWTNTGTQNITSSGNGMDPDPLQLRAANSNTQLLSHTSVTVNSSESHSCVPLPCSSELIPVHTGLEPLQSCPMPSATGDGQAGESSVATTACETHATNEDTVALTGTQLKSSSFTKETDIDPLPVLNAAHGHLEPGVPMVDTTVAPLIHLVPSVPVSLLFLPSVAEGYPSAHHTVLHIPQLSSQTSEPPPTPVYILPSSLSSCLPSSAPQVSVMQAALSTDSQKTATTAVEVGEALGLESVAAGVDDGVVALEDGNTEGFDRFEGNIPGFINYFLNRSSSKKGSTRARTGQRRGGIKRKSAPTRSSKGGTQTECEVPSRGTVTKEAEKTSSESRRLVQGSRHWRPQFGTILQTWRRGEGGGVVGQWSGVMARLEQRQSIRLKLKRQSGEGMWEIVKVEEKAGRVRALSEIGRASRRGRGQPHRRACQPSLSEDTFPIIKRPRSRLRIHPVPCPPAPRQLINALSCDTLPAQQLAPVPQAPLLPNSNCPPQQTLGSAVLHTAPLSPAQVSPVRPISPASPVNPEEPVGQIDKLLEDILLGLNFFPPNSTISQDSYPKSYLPSSTGGLDPDPTVRPCGIQQEQELGVLDSDLSPTESSTRAFLSPSETATSSSSTTLCFGTHSATSRTSCPRASDPFPESFLGISTEPSLEFCHCPLSPSAMCSQVPDTSTKSSSECPKTTSLEVSSAPPIDAPRISQHEAAELNEILDHILQSCEHPSALQSLEEGKQGSQGSTLEDRLVDINIYLGKKSADHAEQWESRNSKMKTGRACTEKSPVIILEKLAEINSLTDKRTKTSDVSGTECNSRNHRVQKWPRGRLRKSTQEVKRDAAVTSGTTAAGVTDVCGVEKGAGRTGEQQWEGGGLLTRGRKRKMEDTGDMWYLGPEPEQIGEHLKPARWSPGLSVRKKSTLKSSSVSKRCSSAFDKTKELQQHNQCKRMLMKSRATEGYGRQTEEQGDQEGQRCHRDREITQGVALWNEWSHTDGGGLPEEQPVNRKAEDDGCEEAVNVEVLEEQPRECSEEGDDGEDTHAEMGRMDKADDGEIKNGDRGERGRNEQSMSPTQSTMLRESEEERQKMQKKWMHCKKQFRSATEPSSQMPPRATNETLEWEEEDAEVDVVECSSPFPIALIKPLLTLDDGSSSPSPSEGEDEEDEEIDVVGEETD